MNTMETKTNENQITISTSTEHERWSLPLNVIIYLALGTFAGIAFILAIFMGANYFVNL